MRKPRKSNPSLRFTTWVFAAENRSPMGASTSATSSRRTSTSALVPCTSTTKSSAYVGHRIMPGVDREPFVGALTEQGNAGDVAFTRAEQDEFSARSHQLAARAW